MSKFLLMGTAVLGGVACSSSPASYSSPVAITMGVKSGDVTAGAITEQKDVNTVSGNPYAAFIQAARTKLGKDPTSIQLDSLTATLDAQSTGVTKLEDIFTGTVKVQFAMNTTGHVFDVGQVSGPTGPGPVTATVTFDDTQLQGTDHSELIGGQFKVSLQGAAATGFASAGANATVDLTFAFAAFE